MFRGFLADDKFCTRLIEIDEVLAADVRARGCVECGARLDRADFARKPRGGVIAAAAETFARRISLCCSREGCRARSTPPSIRFLGRRVYVAVVVVIGALVAHLRAAAIRRETGVPARTVRRWSRWFRDELAVMTAFALAAARFMPPLDVARLPESLLDRFDGDAAERVIFALRWLAPWSTSSPQRS